VQWEKCGGFSCQGGFSLTRRRVLLAVKVKEGSPVKEDLLKWT
jgi:hypothetical protein